jgi:hypothetical protein
MTKFLPENESLVLSRVTFTRCLFAQLQLQEFHPPKPFLRMQPPLDDPDRKAFELGVKLTCGFEMVYQQHRERAQKQQHAHRLTSHSGAQYRDVSKAIDEALQHDLPTPPVVEWWSASTVASTTPSTTTPSSTAAAAVSNKDEISTSSKVEHRPQETGVTQLDPDDDSSWLNVTDAQLDDLLQRKFNIGAKSERQEEDAADELDPTAMNDLVHQLKHFLDVKSDIGGVRSQYDMDAEGEEEEEEHGLEGTTRRTASTTKQQSNEEEKQVRFVDSTTTAAATTKTTTGKTTSTTSATVIESEDDDSDDDSDNFLEDGDDENDYDDVEDLEGSTHGEKLESLRSLMKQMDLELGKHPELANDFERALRGAGGDEEEETVDDDDDDNENDEQLQPLDLNYNLLKNFLESYQSQLGGAGPFGNMLHHIVEQKELSSSSTMSKSTGTTKRKQ